MALLLATSVLACLATVTSALPAAAAAGDDGPLSNLSHPFPELRPAGERRAGSVPLRILSLGASIMSGVGSSTHNGLRKPLRDALRVDGWDVNMVGSLHSGSMKDWEHEAVSGDVLTQIRTRLQNSLGFRPNVVIINAGTNDANGGIDIGNVGSRMQNILNDIWGAPGMTNTCVMLSTLLPTTNAAGAANGPSVNDQYRRLVGTNYVNGKCIYLAEMWPGGTQWFNFAEDYLANEWPQVHPNDGGHKKMASVFYNAINAAAAGRGIPAPGEFTVGPGSCDKFAGTGHDAGGLTQRGSGYDDGIYYHSAAEKGILWSAESDWDRGQWKFARLFDRNHDDLVAWVSKTDDSQVYAVWANSGDGNAKFTQMSDMVPDLNCKYTEGVNFIDMNADGLDDLVYIDADGNAYLSINQGDGNRAAGKSPTFKRVSSSALVKATEGSKREKVVLADLDGDGRGDYGVLDDQGNVYFWRNGGVDNIPSSWQYLGLRFEGKNMGDLRGTRFEDINGDGRDDWVWLSDVGKGYVYTNGRSCKKALNDGDRLNVAWRQGFLSGDTSGVVYKGMGSFVTDKETYLRDRIHFARIYGQADIFGNLPLQDYVFIQHTALSNGKHRFEMRVWKNTGGGATKLMADGNKYCNMMGHANGMVDYVWAYSFGNMEMWANRGKGSISDSDPDGYWDYKGTIWTPPSHMDRRDLHLHDWDGDGDCDIIYVNPNGGGVQVWLNNYPQTGKWDWTYLANPAPGVGCSQKRGLGIHDLAVRFADITGNGRADYLCIEPGSRVTGFTQNNDGSWKNANQIKVSIDKDRANMRWADVNGDGKEDLLWIEKFSGDTFVWYNNGPSDPSQAAGSSFGWRVQDQVAYAGLVAGTCIFYADIDGNGRADEHYVLGTFNNKAQTSLSPTCGLQDVTGDDASFDSTLPKVPSSGGGAGEGSGGGGSDGGGGGSDDGGGTDPGTGIIGAYPSRYRGSDYNCAADRDWFAPTNLVGNPDGGKDFCLAKWRDGIYPNAITVTASSNALCSLTVGFTDGTEQTVGKVCADDTHHRFGTLEWRPFVQYFSQLSLYADGWNGGVGRFLAGIWGNDTLVDSGKYWANGPPDPYNSVIGSDGRGVLLGFAGSAGDRIDSLQPMFSSAGVRIVTVVNATFDPSYETLNTLPFGQRGMEVVSTQIVYDNRDSDIDIPERDKLEVKYVKSTKVTVTNTTGLELGGEAGGTINAEFNFNAAVPWVNASAKAKLEAAGKFIRKDITGKVNATEDSVEESITLSHEFRPVVKAHSYLTCAVAIIQSRVHLRYDGYLHIVFNDGNGYNVDVQGVFEDASGSQIISKCWSPGGDEIINTDDDVLESEGMYCQDDTFLADITADLSAEAWQTLCPNDPIWK